MKTKSKPRFSKRSRMDIIACILEKSNEGSRKTRLIYRCNLSLSLFNLYKEFLVETRLLKVSRREDGVRIFETTQKGKQFLEDYGKIKTCLSG